MHMHIHNRSTFSLLLKKKLRELVIENPGFIEPIASFFPYIIDSSLVLLFFFPTYQTSTQEFYKKKKKNFTPRRDYIGQE